MNAFWLARRWPNLFVLTLILVATWNAPVHSEGDLSALSCGPNSLYVLLDLLGRRANLGDTLRVLPAPHPRGYSLLEIREAARRRGLDLWCGHLTRENTPLDRPVIAFFDGSQTRTGHYAVLVPVGQTGTMVQMIDPPYYPVIVDYKDIIPVRSSIKILYPLSFWQSKWFPVAIIASITIIFSAIYLLPRSRFGFITLRRRARGEMGPGTNGPS